MSDTPTIHNFYWSVDWVEPSYALPPGSPRELAFIQMATAQFERWDPETRQRVLAYLSGRYGSDVDTRPVSPLVGQAVRVLNRTRHPNVVHRLHEISGASAYPYLFGCGYSTSAVEAAERGTVGPDCPGCWTP